MRIGLIDVDSHNFPNLPLRKKGVNKWEMNKKKEIINAIERISGKYSAYEVFTDWIRCMAMSISNSVTPFHGHIWKEREDVYMSTISKYGQDERAMLCEMTAWLAEILDDGPDDVLGDIYMKSGMGSKAAGQFFTPFHLSELCAKLSINTDILEGNDIIELNEPSCGGGGMIIAVARVLNENGINYQQKLDVIAQDLDWKGVYMCYVQLSLLGIRAICVQGDTLIDPYDPKKTEASHKLYTPAKMGVLAI